MKDVVAYKLMYLRNCNNNVYRGVLKIKCCYPYISLDTRSKVRTFLVLCGALLALSSSNLPVLVSHHTSWFLLKETATVLRTVVYTRRILDFSTNGNVDRFKRT
jgi:hypothetical protein